MIRIKTLRLRAGIPETFSINGFYFRVLTAVGVLDIAFDAAATAQMLAGLGFSVDGGYRSITVTSVTDQDIVIAASNGPVDDNRLAGEIDLNGALEMMQTAVRVCIDWSGVCW